MARNEVHRDVRLRSRRSTTCLGPALKQQAGVRNSREEFFVQHSRDRRSSLMPVSLLLERRAQRKQNRFVQMRAAQLQADRQS